MKETRLGKKLVKIYKLSSEYDEETEVTQEMALKEIAKRGKKSFEVKEGIVRLLD